MEPKVKTSAGMETASETVARARALLARPSESAPKTDGSKTSDILSVIEKKLMGGAGMSSSTDSAIEKTISEAITGQKSVQESSARRIESDYKREFDFLTGEASAANTQFMESRSGFATQQAALRRLVGDTDKAFRDLEIRRQDALASNDATTAAEISKLQLTKLQFAQEKEQQFYNNLFSYAQLDAAQSAQKQAASQFREKLEFDKVTRDVQTRTEMGKMAAEYGVTLSGTDTMEDLLSKISVVVDEAKREEAALRWAALADKTQKETERGFYDNVLFDAINDGKGAKGAVYALNEWLQSNGQTLAEDDFKYYLTRAQALEDEYKKTKAQAEAESEGSILKRLFGNGQNINPYQYASQGLLNPRGITPVQS